MTRLQLRRPPQSVGAVAHRSVSPPHRGFHLGFALPFALRLVARTTRAHSSILTIRWRPSSLHQSFSA